MKIAIRGMGSKKLLDRMEKSGASALVGGIHGDLFFDTSWPNPRLSEFLSEAAKRGSIDLNPWMEFTPKEVDTAEFLHVVARKVVQDTQRDYERMRSDIEELPWIGTDPKRRFRVPNRLSLSKHKLKPNQVAGVGEWTGEYVVASGARTVFEDAGFSGVAFRPVFNTRTGEPFDDCFQLWSEHYLDYRILDIASPEFPTGHLSQQGYDALGCLCYDTATLDNAPDFNRTGEQMVAFEFPQWVVRRGVKDCFREHKLKGWAFEPILESGSAAYEEYHELWSSLYRMLANCDAHTIRAQRPFSDN